MSLHATYRDAGNVTVVDLSGRIVLGEGSALLRKTIRGLLDEGRAMILLDLADVDYIDSEGLGSLIQAYTSCKKRGAPIVFVHVFGRNLQLLKTTKLLSVFDVYASQPEAPRAAASMTSAAISPTM